MFIYSRIISEPKLSRTLKEIKSKNDVLAVLRAQGFYDLPGVKNSKYTPDINELSKSIYEFIQRGSPEVKALIYEVLTLTPKTASESKICAIFDQLMKLLIPIITLEEINDPNFYTNFYTFASYFDVMNVSYEQ